MAWWASLSLRPLVARSVSNQKLLHLLGDRLQLPSVDEQRGRQSPIIRVWARPQANSQSRVPGGIAGGCELKLSLKRAPLVLAAPSLPACGQVAKKRCQMRRFVGVNATGTLEVRSAQ